MLKHCRCARCRQPLVAMRFLSTVERGFSAVTRWSPFPQLGRLGEGGHKTPASSRMKATYEAKSAGMTPLGSWSRVGGTPGITLPLLLVAALSRRSSYYPSSDDAPALLQLLGFAADCCWCYCSCCCCLGIYFHIQAYHLTSLLLVKHFIHFLVKTACTEYFVFPPVHSNGRK